MRMKMPCIELPTVSRRRRGSNCGMRRKMNKIRHFPLFITRRLVVLFTWIFFPIHFIHNFFPDEYLQWKRTHAREPDK